MKDEDPKRNKELENERRKRKDGDEDEKRVNKRKEDGREKIGRAHV